MSEIKLHGLDDVLQSMFNEIEAPGPITYDGKNVTMKELVDNITYQAIEYLSDGNFPVNSEDWNLGQKAEFDRLIEKRKTRIKKMFKL